MRRPYKSPWPFKSCFFADGATPSGVGVSAGKAPVVMTQGSQGTAAVMQGPSAGILKKLGDDPERPVFRDQSAVPKLTDNQVRRALTFIPSEYCAMSCWTFREEGHSAFSCPYLTVDQRLHLAHRYNLYQIQANPHMARWLDEQLQAREAAERTFGMPKPEGTRGILSTRGRRWWFSGR